MPLEPNSSHLVGLAPHHLQSSCFHRSSKHSSALCTTTLSLLWAPLRVSGAIGDFACGCLRTFLPPHVQLARLAGCCVCSSLYLICSPLPLQSWACWPGNFLSISSPNTLFSLLSLNFTGIRYCLSWDSLSKLYCMTPHISLSPVSRFFEDPESLSFPELGKFFSISGPLYFLFYTWTDIISSLSLFLYSNILLKRSSLVFLSYTEILVTSFPSPIFMLRYVYYDCRCCPTCSLDCEPHAAMLVCISVFDGLSLAACLALGRPSVIIWVNEWIVSFVISIILGTEQTLRKGLLKD